MNHLKNLSVCLLMSLIFINCKKKEDSSPALNPNIDFTYTPKTPIAGEAVQFEAEPEYGSSKIVSWSWSFGYDGTSMEEKPVYTFANDGSYTVKLVGTDAAGKKDSVSHEIKVSPKPEADFSASVMWNYSTGTKVTLANDATAPVIDDNGNIYYVSSYAVDGRHGEIVAVKDQDDKANKIWSTTIDYYSLNAPAIGRDGNIYWGAWAVDGIYKFDSKDGSIMWTQTTNSGVSNCTPAIDQDGNIYVSTKGSASSGLFSFSSEGVQRWSVLNIGSAYASPAISKDGSTVYFLMTAGGSLYAINTADGTQKWSTPVDVSEGLGTSLSIGGDGTIYLTTNTEVVAVNDEGSQGSVKWAVPVDSPNGSGVVVSPDGNTIYTGSADGLLSLKASDGSANWTYDTKISESVPAIDKNGNIYFGTDDGEFVIVDEEGQLLKSFSIGDGVVNSPTIAENGNVYVAALKDEKIELYKIKVENSGPANHWPMKGQGRKHNAVAL